MLKIWNNVSMRTWKFSNLNNRELDLKTDRIYLCQWKHKIITKYLPIANIFFLSLFYSAFNKTPSFLIRIKKLG